jgi:hypothetical protein
MVDCSRRIPCIRIFSFERSFAELWSLAGLTRMRLSSTRVTIFSYAELLEVQKEAQKDLQGWKSAEDHDSCLRYLVLTQPNFALN